MKAVKDKIKLLDESIAESLFAANNETQWINTKIESMDHLK